MVCCRRPAPARPEDDDHEEEFYYNEIEVPLSMTSLRPMGHQKPVLVSGKTVAKLVQADKTLVIQAAGQGKVAVKAPMLSDHMDMARPPHENPEYGGQSRPILPATSPAYATIISSNGTPLQWSKEGAMVPVAAAAAAAAGQSSGEQQAQQQQPPAQTGPVNLSTQPGSVAGAMHAVPIAIPITTFTIASNQHVSRAIVTP